MRMYDLDPTYVIIEVDITLFVHLEARRGESALIGTLAFQGSDAA